MSAVAPIELTTNSVSWLGIFCHFMSSPSSTCRKYYTLCFEFEKRNKKTEKNLNVINEDDLEFEHELEKSRSQLQSQ